MQETGAGQWQEIKVWQVSERLSVYISVVSKGMINLLSFEMAKCTKETPNYAITMTRPEGEII